jgi:RND family efflux transporter MFP subunit
MKPLLLLSLLPVLVFTGCGRSPAPAAADSLPVLRVKVATVETSGSAQSQPLAGTVRPAQRATVSAQVMGTVERTSLAVGREVKAGDLLVTLRAAEMDARVQQARANLSHATREYERESALLQQGAATAETVRALADRREGAAAALAEAESLQGYTRVTAPFAGVITRDLVRPGDLATPGTPLFTLEATDQLQVEVQVPESFERPARGVSLPVRIEGRDVPGELVEISPSADGSSRTRLAKLNLPPDAPARSGQFVRVLWPRAESQTLWVPAPTVSSFGQMDRVFVVEEGRARLRLVRLGARLEDRVAVLSGLNSGEQVVVAAPAGLRDGQQVEVMP